MLAKYIVPLGAMLFTLKAYALMPQNYWQWNYVGSFTPLVPHACALVESHIIILNDDVVDDWIMFL